MISKSNRWVLEAWKSWKMNSRMGSECSRLVAFRDVVERWCRIQYAFARVKDPNVRPDTRL